MRALRILAIALLTAIAVATNLAELSLIWHPFAMLRITAAADGTVLDSSRSRAANIIRPGDRIDFSRLSPDDRDSFLRPVVPGRVFAIALATGKTVAVRAATIQRWFGLNVSMVLEVATSLIFILVAATLVWLRPGPVTYAFFFFAYPFTDFQATPNLLPFHIRIMGGALMEALSLISAPALLSFALRFPNVTPSRLARKAEAAAYVLAGALIVLRITESWRYIFFAAAVHGRIAVVTGQLGLYACAVAVLIARYVTAKDSNRSALQWVVAAFAVAFIPILVLVNAAELRLFVPTGLMYNFAEAWEVLAPLAVAYTVLRHRLFDIRFFISRALLYTVLTSIAVGGLALADWAFGRWLAESRFAIAGELALALVLGIALTTAHKRIEHVLNNVIFRSQTAALHALRRFSQETDLIADPARLIAQTHEMLHARIECTYNAVYTVDGAVYTLATPKQSPLAPIIPGDDFTALRLRRWGEPFECDDPNHPLRGALLVPMQARGQLVGFIVCGPKRDRTHYLPEEIDTLTTLAHHVGGAYAWLTLRPSIAAHTEILATE